MIFRIVIVLLDLLVTVCFAPHPEAEVDDA